MEFIEFTAGKNIIKISGNARIRILNDYDNGLIDKKYISFKDGNMFITSSNIDNINIPDYKCHILFEYINKCPNILCIWNYDDYIPYHLHPDKNVNLKILDEFNINKKSLLYQELSQINANEISTAESKNEEILYADYICDRFIDEVIPRKNKKIRYPSYIHINGEFIRINNAPEIVQEVYHDDIEITDFSSDIE